MKTLWVITREENQYDQYGEYFVAAFSEKPTLDNLIRLFGDIILAKHILKGGGRMILEDTWYNLKRVNEGQMF